jgi:hypothetical protein
LNLAEDFTKVLSEFGVSDKVDNIRSLLNTYISLQILSVTANNAANNNMMTAELADKVAHFRGETARTQCFLHIVNLVVKSVLKQFDIPKKQVDNLLARDEELHELARDIDLEDEMTIVENGDGDPDTEDADNMEGWTDEVEALTDDERDEPEGQIHPVRLVLVKVSVGKCTPVTADLPSKLRKLSYKLIHSLTLLLLEWKWILAEHKLPVQIMLHDVSTRWNSTFNMLDFALQYR